MDIYYIILIAYVEHFLNNIILLNNFNILNIYSSIAADETIQTPTSPRSWWFLCDYNI
jgi:hypothetical protein